MGFNSGKIKVQSSAKKKTNPFGKDVIVDPAGQWKYPGHITKVPSGNITMNGVPYPVYGVDNLGNGQMMYPGANYQFPGNMVTEYPMFQNGGANNPAYQQYMQNIQAQVPEFEKGRKSFSPDISNFPDAAGIDPNNFNCIGGACNYAQTAGADIPIIPGNSSFWGQAERGQIPVDIYAGPNTMDRSLILDYIAPGDFIGWDEPLLRDDKGNIIYETDTYGNPVYYTEGRFKGQPKPTGGRNAAYPEHSQVVVKNDPEAKKVWVMDAQGTWDKEGNKAYDLEEYTYDEIISGKSYGNIYLGRPTRFGGKDVEFNHPKTDFKHYFPNVSDEELSKLKPLKFNYDKKKLAENLNADQIKTLGSLSKALISRKKDFIKATGMSEADYDEIARMLPGLAMQETKLGKTNPTPWQGAKNILSGDFKDAFRTQFEEGKQIAGDLIGRATSKGILQIKEDILFNAPETKIALKRLGITKDNYDPNNPEHNALAAMVFFDNANKYGVKNFNKKGNNPNLPLSEKLLYLYNQPQTVGSGKARAGKGYPASEYTVDEKGKPTYNRYVKNVLGFNPYTDDTQYAVTRQFGGEAYEEMELTDKEVEEYRKGGYIVEEYQDGGTKYNTPEYRKAYEQGTVTRYNPETDTYQAPDLPEFQVQPRSMTEDLDYIGHTVMDFVGEVSGINPAIRIMDDPIGAAKGTGQTIADLAMYSNPGSAMYAQMSNTNPITGQPYWGGLDQALDVAGLVPIPASKTLKLGQLARPLIKNFKKAIPGSSSRRAVNMMDNPLTPNLNIEDLRTAYHNSERILLPEEVALLHKKGYGKSSSYIADTPPPIPGSEMANYRQWIANNNVFNANPASRYRNLSTRDVFENISSLQERWQKTLKKDKIIKNRSGLTKDEALQVTTGKNKEKISKLSEKEFENTVLKPTGEVVDYTPYVSGVKKGDKIPLSTEEYADMFNERLDKLNEIIAANNKTGVEYRVTGLTPEGFLKFYTPSLNKESIWKVKINPGQWRGDVQDIPSLPYVRDEIPGLHMDNTLGGVFGDRVARRGSGAYSSINEYLKTFDLGRVKPGFNSQTESSKGLWESAIKSGDAVGWYGNPGTVYGTMKTVAPITGLGYLGYQTLPEQRDGGEIMELTEAEVAELKKQGYRIENV